ncbi:MAG: endonuclease domain-containing protein [Oscillospiraceae bacterium]|nr:endonuclease domain-containing protein [Oscillospiraceae bacterium]
MTKEERRLYYDFLKQLPVTVNRQKVLGAYIVDFYCAEKHLVIELDGSQHFEAAGLAADRERDRALHGMGLTVLRYANNDVMQRFDSVCEDILQHMKIDTQHSEDAHPKPSP